MLIRLLSLLCLLLPLPATAQSLDHVVSHRILPGWQQSDGTIIAALELTLAPGWKTYWRAPGDAGIPPEFDWSRARNVKAINLHWPTPKVFWQSGMRSIGYADRLILPFSITPKRAGKDLHLRGTLDMGICSDICVPHRLRFDATLPADADARHPAIVAALSDMPYTAKEAGLRTAHCSFAPTADGLQITARLTLPRTGQREEAVIEAPAPGIWVSEPKTNRKGDQLTLTAEMIRPAATQPLAIDRSRIRITVLGSDHSVDIQGCQAG